MNAITRRFSFITSAFPHGAYQSQGFNRPELRAPSIKGQLRWWFDALVGKTAEEHRLFGHVSSKPNQDLGLHGNLASRIIVRVMPIGTPPSTRKTSFMPHKRGDGGIKEAIPPGATFEVSLVPRRDGINDAERTTLERCLDAWLLFGAVGQRANRGAGSPWPDDAPDTQQEYEARAAVLLKDSNLRMALLGTVADDMDLRDIAGNILADEAFRSCQTPFGSADPRKPSPIKFRAAMFAGELHLVAIWDGRHQRPDQLRHGVEILANAGKPVGKRLKEHLDALAY